MTKKGDSSLHYMEDTDWGSVHSAAGFDSLHTFPLQNLWQQQPLGEKLALLTLTALQWQEQGC